MGIAGLIPEGLIMTRSIFGIQVDGPLTRRFFSGDKGTIQNGSLLYTVRSKDVCDK